MFIQYQTVRNAVVGLVVVGVGATAYYRYGSGQSTRCESKSTCNKPKLHRQQPTHQHTSHPEPANATGRETSVVVTQPEQIPSTTTYEPTAATTPARSKPEPNSHFR